MPSMRRRRLVPVLLSAATPTLGVGLAPTVAAETPQNPWLQQRVLHLAHSGGEDEAPMDTMSAFRQAVDLGSDMIDIVGSFNDTALADFHTHAPQVPVSAGRDAMIGYFFGG